MNKEIVKQIQEQFDKMPKKIISYIMDYFGQYVKDNVFKPLTKFSIGTSERWIKAERNNVNSVYALPDKIFNRIQKENEQDFINTWNRVLKFIWNDLHPHQSNQTNKKYNHLYLMVRGHLILDYGYFDAVDTNKLFRVNDETKNK